MKIRTQFIVTTILFLTILAAISLGLVYVNQQSMRLETQQSFSDNVERAANELSYLSNEYLLYGESQQYARWEAQYNSLSTSLNQLQMTKPTEVGLVNDLKGNLQRLKSVFEDVSTTMATRDSPVSKNMEALQVAWSRLQVQHQGMIFSASLLSKKLEASADQMARLAIFLILVLVGFFGVYLLANYSLVYQRMMKAVAELRQGAEVVGSGNLDYVIPVRREDEVGSLSQSFNRMAANLKAVTASRHDLAREVAERERAETELRQLNVELELRVAAATTELRQANESLEQRIAERTTEVQRTNQELEKSRKAALNLLEDSLTSEKQLQLANERLVESEFHYRSLFDGMTEGFALHEIICDDLGKPVDYVFLEVNAAFEAMTGLKKENVEGKTHNEILPDDSPLWVEQYGQVVLTGEPVHFENYSPVLKRHYDVLAYRPAPGRFAVIFMDITERKRMEVELKNTRAEAERRANELDTIFNSITDGIIVYSEDTHIQRANPAAVRLMGFDPTGESIASLAKRLSTRTLDGNLMDPNTSPTTRALYGETNAALHYVFCNARGEEIVALVSASPLRTENRISGVVAIWQDVTEQHKAEEIETWLASFPKLNPSPVVETDLSQKINYINPAAQRFFPDLESAGKSHSWLADLDEMFVKFEKGQGTTYSREVQVNQRTFLETVQYIAESKRVRMYGVEITALKQAEQALREARDELDLRVQERTLELSQANLQLDKERRRFNDVLEMLPAYLILLNADYKTTFTNRYFRERFGESNGAPCYKFLFGRDEPCEVCETYKVMQTGKPLQWEWIGPDKHTYDVHDFPFTDVDGTRLILEMGIDITERKNAESQLRLQTSAMEAAANGIIITDRNGSIQWCNPAFAAVTGYSCDEVIGLNPRMLKSGKHTKNFYESMWQTLLNGQVWHGEMINRRKDGGLYEEEQIITPVRNEKGEITHFIAIKQDITERKQAEEAIRHANAYNRSLLEASLDPQMTITPHGKIGDINTATEKVTGKSRNELIGTDFQELFTNPDRARLAYEKVFETGSLHDFELEIRHLDGHVSPVLYNGSVFQDETGKVQGVFGVARDITDRKQFEAQLMQAEKHAVVGRMVGSVTHEINNPLQTIKNCLYLIQQDTEAESVITEPLDMAVSETARLTDLVGQLRELYRPRTDFQAHPHELMDILEEIHALLTPHLNNSRVEWEALTGITRCYINCVRDQILEVFLNICMNAIEAMQATGGTLSVNMLFKEEQVGVIFKDSGPGIPMDVITHIFEPFMTTKSSGLGLGLSISYGIVQRHGGQILVENSQDGGACFTVWLPVARKNKKEKNKNAH